MKLVEVKCPYCKVVQNVDTDMFEHVDCRPAVIECNVEEYPGCGRWFALKVSWKPIVTTYIIIQTDNFGGV